MLEEQPVPVISGKHPCYDKILLRQLADQNDSLRNRISPGIKGRKEVTLRPLCKTFVTLCGIIYFSSIILQHE